MPFFEDNTLCLLVGDPAEKCLANFAQADSQVQPIRGLYGLKSLGNPHWFSSRVRCLDDGDHPATSHTMLMIVLQPEHALHGAY